MNKIIQYWDAHGTKILGSLLSILGTVQIILGAVSADPHLSLLVTPKQFALLSLVNVALSAAVVRRGFTNSAKTP